VLGGVVVGLVVGLVIDLLYRFVLYEARVIRERHATALQRAAAEQATVQPAAVRVQAEREG
jgi:hypothetical protein